LRGRHGSMYAIVIRNGIHTHVYSIGLDGIPCIMNGTDTSMVRHQYIDSSATFRTQLNSFATTHRRMHHLFPRCYTPPFGGSRTPGFYTTFVPFDHPFLTVEATACCPDLVLCRAASWTHSPFFFARCFDPAMNTPVALYLPHSSIRTFLSHPHLIKFSGTGRTFSWLLVTVAGGMHGVWYMYNKRRYLFIFFELRALCCHPPAFESFKKNNVPM
jgi:hypothetical protein